MKNYRSMIKMLSLIAGIFLVSSCKKFLDEAPSKTSSLVVKTTDQINALLNRFDNFYPENNRTAMYSTDDYGQNLDLYNARRASFSNMAVIEFMLWDTQYLPNDGREGFWGGEFKKIFIANLALNELDNVTGSAEDKAIIKADAHFIRAYSYWELANTYCLPYTEANKNEPGLPIKTSTSFEQPLQRQPLERVYELIESDLAEALKIPIGINQSGKVRNWRASKASVNAFAARYYLHRGNYAKAVEHANASLADYNVLIDYNTDMRYGNDRNAVINPGPNQQIIPLKMPYTAINQLEINQSDLIGWKELLYMRANTEVSFWIIPSQDLLNLYDKNNDLRYRYHIVESWSYARGLNNPPYDYPGYLFFFWDTVPTGPTVAEVLLTKAEAQARLNDPATAMNTLNLLRVKRMVTNAPGVMLTATGKDDAIKKILEERRRELPFGQRWFDIRRYNNNDDQNDDVVLTRTFYPYNGTSILFDQAPKVYSLPKNSRRFAAPIPQTEIISSNSVIQQNTY